MQLIQYAHEKMYKLLKQELAESMERGPCKNSVERCFIIAGNYWSELKATIEEYKFKTEEEEILFFKTIKPLFTAELEYYSLLYHALLFCPIDPERQLQFWDREGKRLADFKEQHKDFVDYCDSGSTVNDEQYYLRKNDTNEPGDGMQSQDVQTQAGTRHDDLISKLWALKRYNDYVKTKLIEVRKLI